MKTADAERRARGTDVVRQSESHGESFQGWIKGGLEFCPDVADEAAELLLDRIQEAVDLVRVSLGKQFDAAVGQVPDVPDDLEPASQPSAGRSESDPLNPAREKDAAPFLSHEISLIRTRHATRGIAAAPDQAQIRSMNVKNLS
jgi:hypothetical protein